MKDKKIKMIIADLDGTLLTKVDYVPPANIEAFHQAKKAGVIPVIATGRLEKDSVFAAEALDAKDYIITMNGLMIYDYLKQKPLVDRHMPDQAAMDVLNMLDRERVYYQLYAENKTFATMHSVDCLPYSGMQSSYYEFYKHSGNVEGGMWDFIKKNGLKVDKMFVSAADPEVLEKIRRRVISIKDLRAVGSGKSYIEVLPDGTDKKEAVELLSEYVGIPLSQTMIIGDSENDVGMLSVGGLSVAMGNGSEAAKKVADVTAPTNLENGVAWAIQKFILQDL